MKAPSSPPSLKARALQCLAQREHSRAELRRKLLAHLRTREATGADEAADKAAVGPEQVDALLDWLEAHKYLSHERFIESRVHARAARFGNLRIRQELAQHQLALTPEAAQALKLSELERARAVWARKFSAGPATAAERAKQTRFLTGRGFSADVIHQLLRGLAQSVGRRTEVFEPDE